MSARRVLLTGAGGVLGTELLERLRASSAVAVTGVTRRGDADGGVLAWRLGEEPCPPALAGPWDVVVHSAASTRWNMTPEEAVAANVRSTEALAAVVGPRTHVVHVSTAYAEGLRGSTASTDLGAYRNGYEWSKAASERLVRDRFGAVTIVRPPLIIGRRRDGRVARFTGVYTFLRAATTGLAPALVADPDAYLEVAPVDDVASRIVELAVGAPPTAPVVDVIARGERALRVREALAIAQAGLNEVRARHGRPPLEPSPMIDPRSWERFYLPFARQHLHPSQLKVLELLSAFTPYLKIRTPLAVDTFIADVAPALRRSIAHWAESRPGAALTEPRAWSARPAAA